jgi:hypothetical protein
VIFLKPWDNLPRDQPLDALTQVQILSLHFHSTSLHFTAGRCSFPAPTHNSPGQWGHSPASTVQPKQGPQPQGQNEKRRPEHEPGRPIPIQFRLNPLRSTHRLDPQIPQRS